MATPYPGAVVAGATDTGGAAGAPTVVQTGVRVNGRTEGSAHDITNGNADAGVDLRRVSATASDLFAANSRTKSKVHRYKRAVHF